MPDLNQLLQQMIAKGASDIFLTCGAKPRIKINGTSSALDLPPLLRGEVRELAYSVMNERQKATFEETMEANLSYSFGQAGRFRINVFRQRGETGMVIRLIRAESRSFEQLGLPRACAGLAMLKRGLVLVVGAAGSGKSTTLAAMINHRAANADGHILTIEDPIESLFRHNRSLVDQREVSVDTRSFGDALHNALREAPDVIMIGEIRDPETARHALSYANTGHLCLSTLHANNAEQVLDRYLDFFPPSAHKQLLTDLSLNLKAVIAQRLIPGTDGKAAVAVELMLGSPRIADLIREGQIGELRDAIAKAGDSGMQSFDQSLYELYLAGRISLDEALRNADSRTDLGLRIRLSQRRTTEDAPSFQMADASAAEDKGKLYPLR